MSVLDAENINKVKYYNTKKEIFSGIFVYHLFFYHIAVTSQIYVVETRVAPPNPKSLATFSHALADIQTQTVVRDSEQSVVCP